MNTNYIIADDGSIVLMHDAEVYTIDTGHVNYTQIVAALTDEDFDSLDVLINVAETICNNVKGVSVENGIVFYNGSELHNTMTERIIRFMQQGLPYKPLLNFLANIMENPSARSVNELYGFLAHQGMPITEDGCFVGYKAIRDDYTDKYTGKVSNKVGSVISMPRNLVDDNFQNTCSVGFHVGAHSYASTFGSDNDRMVLVKVNPRHAVSVPNDHDATKLRVCEYEVIEEHAVKTILTEELYAPIVAQGPLESPDGFCDDDDDDDDYEDDDGWGDYRY